MQTFVADFEAAIWQALRDVFDDPEYEAVRSTSARPCGGRPKSVDCRMHTVAEMLYID